MKLKINRGLFSERLVLAGGIIFAAGIAWIPILGYLGIAVGLIGICIDYNSRDVPSAAKALLIFICFFLLWGLILSLAVAIQPGQAFATVFAYACHWLFPFALGFWLKDKFRISLLYLFAISILVVGVLSLGAYLNFYQSPNLAKEGMIWGLHHHIAFAAMLLMLFHLIYGTALAPDISNKKTLIFLLIAILIIFLVVLTGSRSYWLAGAITITCATIHKAIIGHRRKLSLAFIVTGILAVSFGVLAFPQVRQRIQLTNFDDLNFIYRKNMAIMASDMIKDYPVTGIGPGQIPYARKYYDKMADQKLPIETGYLEKKHLHNMYLQIGAEFGIIGFLLFFAILLTSLRISGLAATFAGTGYHSGIAMGVFWSIITIAVGDFFDCLLRGPTVAMILFWLIGMSAGILRAEKKVQL
jgi:O-antigen ligase